MLSDKDAYNIAKIYEQIENELIADMMKNLSRHRAEETKEGYDWEQWQVLQLQALEEYKRKNLAKYKPKSLAVRVRQAITKANEVGGADAEKKILNMIKRGADIKRQGSDNFFRINEARVNALIDAVNNDLGKAEYALLRQANDEYRKIIYKTQLQASTGAITYEKAVDNATKDFLTAGIQCVQYRNGARHQISSYAEMAIRTSMKRAYMQGEGAKRQEWGVHTVIVNHRNHACSKCLPFVGKVLVDDVYSGGTALEAMQMKVPLLSSAMDAGLFHPNCKDGLSTYFDGISDKPQPMTKQEIAFAEAYEDVETDVNVAERKMQAFTRLAEYALDPADKRMYTAKAEEWKAKYEALLNTRESMPGDITAKIPPVQRPTIREPIKLDYTSKWQGLIEVPDDWIQLEEDTDWSGGKYYMVKEPTKRFEIPWDSLAKSTQTPFRWNNPSRYGKPFLIQKKDISGMLARTELGRWSEQQFKGLIDDGYEFQYRVSFWKYHTPYELYFFKKDGKLYTVLNDVDRIRAVTPESVKAVKKRQDKVSNMLWDKKVHFRDLTQRQGDNWVKAMQEFHTAVEADLPISWVTEEEYDALESPALLRGFALNSHLRGDITSGGLTARQMAEQLATGGVGNCFPSRGVYGDCIAYLSDNEKLAYQYATGYSSSDHGFIAEFKLKKDAKGITYTEAKELFEALNRTELTAGADPYFSTQQRRLTNGVEVGKAMQLLGYDYIIEENGDGLHIPFYMVLNRDALVACPSKWVRNGDVRIGWKGYGR